MPARKDDNDFCLHCKLGPFIMEQVEKHDLTLAHVIQSLAEALADFLVEVPDEMERNSCIVIVHQKLDEYIRNNLEEDGEPPPPTVTTSRLQ